MDALRREATPVEIAALLMNAVCTPAEREQAALAELAEQIGVDLGHLQSELMLLRAFAVDFAMAMTLGQTLVRRAILMRIHQHWDAWTAKSAPGCWKICRTVWFSTVKRSERWWEIRLDLAA